MFLSFDQVSTTELYLNMHVSVFVRCFLGLGRGGVKRGDPGGRKLANNPDPMEVHRAAIVDPHAWVKAKGYGTLLFFFFPWNQFRKPTFEGRIQESKQAILPASKQARREGGKPERQPESKQA